MRPAPCQSEKTGEIFLIPVVVSAMLSVMVAPSALSAPSGVAVSMYELPLLAGHSSSSAQAMNDAGDVVGLSLDENEEGYLVRWGADGSLTRLQAVSGGSGGQAVKIVEDGTVAGFTATADGVRHAARWDASGALTRLQEPPGYVDGEAQDINDAHVAVGRLSTAGRTRPVRWGADGRATVLRLPARAEGAWPPGSTSGERSPATCSCRARRPGPCAGTQRAVSTISARSGARTASRPRSTTAAR